jgi:predicted ATPase/DNA-binding CsgD family transcriptional regulator
VYFVPLQPLTTPDFIVPTIADSLKFTFYGEGDPKTQLLHYLRDKHLLLLLDNFEHLLDGVDLLPEILDHAPGVKLLVTSRERLHLREEWVFDVRGLFYPEQDTGDWLDDYTAIQLFIQHARRAGYALADEDRPAIIHICQLVEGMPLAIELAAAWVRHMPCVEIARQIESSLDLLTTTIRNVPDKHRSMHAAFEHSWRLLTEEERAVYGKLSVFRGGFTRNAAEQVAGATLPILVSLVDKSLLRVDASGRYSLQELLRQYAAYQLDYSGEADATRNVHCAYYAEFLRQREPDLKGSHQVTALDEIEAELDNVRLSWRWAVEQRREQDILQSLSSLCLFYQIRSRTQEGADAFTIAANRFGDVENLLLAQLLLCQGWFQDYRVHASEHIHKGMTLFLRQRGADMTMPLPLLLVISLVDEFGGYEGLHKFYQDCLTAARIRGDAWGAAWSLHCMGALAWVFEKYVEAQSFLQQGRAGFRALGDGWGMSWQVSILGQVEQELKNYVAARQYHQEHLALCKEVGDIAGVSFALGQLGIVALALGEPESYRRYVGEALKLSLELTFVPGIWQVLYGIARDLAAQEGKTEQAVELYTLLLHTVYDGGVRYNKDDILSQLDTLKPKLPPGIFDAAVRRGQAASLEGAATAFLDQFLAPDEPQMVAAGNTSPLPNQSLIDPLTTRELEILRLIAAGLSNREIADQLVLAATTVKWYVNQIFSKLDAHSRTHAIARASEFKLLS